MIIIPFIYSFKINKVNSFHVLMASFSLIFLSNLFIAFEAAFRATLLTNFGKASLVKEQKGSLVLFCLAYLSYCQEIHPIELF